jgi:aspartokinase
MIHTLRETHIFDGKDYLVEVQFLESLDLSMNYEIVKIVGQTMPTQNWIAENVTSAYGRKKLNNRMQEIIYKVKNPKPNFSKLSNYDKV